MYELRALAQIAHDSAWEAYETTYFSDAKSDVYAVLNYVEESTEIPAHLQAELLQCAQDSWTCITNRSSNYRGANASRLMARICNIIDTYYAESELSQQSQDSLEVNAANVNSDLPRNNDAVLGGLETYPSTALTLGGLEGVKQQYQSSSTELQIAAMQKAMAYGELGIDLVLMALENEKPEVQKAAYRLLKSKGEDNPKAKQAIQKILERIEELESTLESKLSSLSQYSSLSNQIAVHLSIESWTILGSEYEKEKEECELVKLELLKAKAIANL